MKKLLMTTAIILPLAFVPVYAQETAPAADPAAGMATGDAAAADAEAAAEAAEKEALKAEVASSGKVAQEQAGNELRLEWITDAQVTAADGTAIGGINDLIVDGETGQMIAAVIGVGGFLGIGEKQIAVPWEQLTVNADAQEITTDLTKDEADVAPAYVFRERAPAPGAAVEGEGGMAVPAGDGGMADPAAAPAGDGMADPAAAPDEGMADPAAGGDPAATGEAPAEEGAATMEEGAETMEEGAATMEEGANEAADATGEAAGDAASDMEGAIDSAVDEAGQAVDDAAAAVEGALNPDEAGEAATETQ